MTTFTTQDRQDAQRTPLTDAEITKIYKEVSEPFGEKRLYEIHDFARAIEKAHGIGK
jgi:hypothetical protein